MYLGRAEEGTVLTFYTRVDIANNNQLSTSASFVQLASTEYAVYVNVNTHPEAVQNGVDFINGLSQLPSEGTMPGELYGEAVAYMVGAGN